MKNELEHLLTLAGALLLVWLLYHVHIHWQHILAGFVGGCLGALPVVAFRRRRL